MIADQDAFVVDESTLVDIVTFVWQTFVDDDLQPTAPDHAPTGMCSTIAIGGAWTATLVVTVELELARSFAGSLLMTGLDELTDDDVTDALGELANVVGGNVKGLVDDETATLSLPAVSTGAPSITGGQQTVCATFLAGGRRMTWQLFERP